MSTTVHFGSNTTEFPLAGAPAVANSVASFEIVPSATVTAEAVLAAVQGAGSYTLTTDGAAGAEQDNFVLQGNVSLDSSTGNILVVLRQKTTDQITIASLQEQVAALGQQAVALSLGG